MLTAKQLDTSGHVPAHGKIAVFTWPDLSPFAQGYVEAMLRSMPPFTDRGREYCVQFHRLASETLAAILRDCEAASYGETGVAAPNTKENGGAFWRMRNNHQEFLAERFGDGFPPLTLSLGDDGKVYAREAS